MNIQQACWCHNPVPQPGGGKQPPAEQPASQPAAKPVATNNAGVATFSYSYSASYFTRAYVSAASQSVVQTGNAPAQGNDPAAGAAEERGTGPTVTARTAKVLTGTVRAALRPDALPPADAGPQAAAAASTTSTGGATAAGEPAGAPDSGKPAIERAEAPEFRKFRLKQFQASLETTLELELETREGDRITLDFSQVEALSRTRFHGQDDDGGRMGFRETAQSLERLVNIEISGDISEEERAAIDALFDRVLEVANSFFGGSTEAALDKVRDMEIDTDMLLDFSLAMSQKRSVEATRAYRNGDAGLERLAQRDVEVSRTLEYLSESQRGLVQEAREVLDDRSAAKMVRSLLPAMLEKSKLELAEAVDDGRAEPAAAG